MIAKLGGPRALDTLVIDNSIYALTFQDGTIGYIREDVFVPVNERQLIKSKQRRGGATTWELKPVGRERVDKQPERKPVEKLFVVNLSYEKGPMETFRIRGADEKIARSKGIRKYAAVKQVPFSRAFEYFNRHPDSITVKEL